MSAIAANETRLTLNYCQEKPIGPLRAGTHSGCLQVDPNASIEDLRKQIMGQLLRDFPPHSKLFLYKVFNLYNRYIRKSLMKPIGHAPTHVYRDNGGPRIRFDSKQR